MSENTPIIPISRVTRPGRTPFVPSATRNTPSARNPRPAAASITTAQKQANEANWDSLGGVYTQPFTVKPGSDSIYSLDPNGGKCKFNIVADFKWTRSSYREEVPRIQLKELEITGLQQLQYYLNNALKIVNSTGLTSNAGGVGGLSDPYGALYDVKPTGFSYVFPFYAANYATSSNSWTEKVPTDADYLSGFADAASKGVPLASDLFAKFAAGASGPIGRVAGPILGSMLNGMAGMSSNQMKRSIGSLTNAAIKTKGLLSGSPYAGIEQPMYFSGSNKNTHIISFPLFNTDSLEEIRRNYDFIRAFQFQNLIKRTSIATYTPPVIYQTEVAEGGYNTGIGSQYFFVSNFVVKNLGAIRSIDIKNGGIRVPIPEAYEVNISISEMITTSKNIYTSVMSKTGGSAVSVFK